jgi:hypothetical protein
MAVVERYMFYYMDRILEKKFDEAIEIAQNIITHCENEESELIKGFLAAAKSLEALKVGEFDEVEELWNHFENSQKFLLPQNRHYALMLEMKLILQNMKEEIERII